MLKIFVTPGSPSISPRIDFHDTTETHSIKFYQIINGVTVATAEGPEVFDAAYTTDSGSRVEIPAREFMEVMTLVINRLAEGKWKDQ